MQTLVQSGTAPAVSPSFPKPGASSRLTVLALLLLSIVLYIGTAFTPGLLDDADASHAVVAREMLQRHDYVILYMNGIRYLMKAPFHYWLVAASYALFGVSEFSTRLPVALAMIGLVLMVYEFARRFFGERAGLYSGLAVGTSVGMFIFTRIMIPEAIYALQFTAIYYLFLRAWTGSLRPRVGYWGAAVVMALAVLTRGLVGIVFPLGGMIGFIIFSRGWNRWREMHLFSSATIFLIIAAPWHILAELRAPGFFWSYFINEHVNRALGTRFPPDYDAVPLPLWWALHLAWFFPWIVFLPFALKQLPSPRTWWRGLSVDAQARLLLFTWAAAILGFFSVFGGSRMEYYSFGAWPAIAILLGLGLARAEETRDRWLGKIQGAMAALGVLVAAILGYFVWDSWRVRPSGDISGLLQTHPTDFYRLSMAHMLDLTPEAFADLRVPAIIAGLSFAGALTAAWLLRRRGRSIACSAVVALGMVGFFFAANMAYKVFEPHMSSKPLALKIKQQIRPEDQIAFYGEFDTVSSVSFYTGRKVWIYNGRYNNLEFGSRFPDAPHIFLTDAEFPGFWTQPQRVFLVVPSEQREKAAPRLLAQADKAWVFAEAGGKTVYVNHPLTPGQPSLADLQATGK